ncbi:unnamed protein product [Phytophthora fragariaefolia]|uniref:Unnamed protein product n=1 Tax=Phytophthora fragariaefolia TaxID=1490495 RepID=A0A9W6XJU1_9STRA|nr:unnamed protein product [Phytophthora fragariaefolia]
MSNTPSSSNAASAPSTTFTSLTVATVVTTIPASMMSPMPTATSVPVTAAAHGFGGVSAIPALTVDTVSSAGIVPGLTAGVWTGVPVAGSVGGASAGAVATAGTALPAVVSGGAYTGGIAGAPGAGGVDYTTGGFNFGGFPPSQVGYGIPRGVFGGTTSVPVKMDNVPKMKGSFDLYAVQLRTFLTRMGCWAVVDGSIDRCDPCFAAKDNLAREAILYGVAAQDAEMICQEDTAQAMWTRFVDKQTKREYSNYIFARAEFYSHVNLKPAGIAACGKETKPPKEKKQSPAKGKHKRSGHGKRQKDGKPGGKKSGKQETRTCYHCGESGHIRPNCPNRDDDSSDDQAAETQTAISERKRWQKRPDKGGENKKRKVSAVGCIFREALAVGSVLSAGEDTVEWALDSASDVHVCKQPELLSELQRDSKHVFQGYDGKVTDNERVGNGHLRVRNTNQPHQDVMLQMQNVLLKPSAPDNLLSLDALEKAGWTLKTGKQGSDRIAWITKGPLQLLLVKSRGRYRLKTTASAVYRFPAVNQRNRRDDALSLVLWHLRFNHLNLPALQQMARQQVTTGMDETLYDDADVPYWS